jgi:tetratricopeptide (TPR) repeat protein
MANRMTTKNRTDPRRSFVPRYLPWLLAIAMLGVYWATLNRGVTLYNLAHVARLSGWTWGPECYQPLTYVLTYPLRWLPTGQIPLALNLFSAVCAALTLGLLARSVALLPQDRTEAQRLRETSDFSFLTLRSAWLPPVLAVLVCGLQFTFWEYATNFTGENVDLLVFAFTIWSLLEYRLDEQEWRLIAVMAAYGAGMTEDAGLIGFLPLLVAALIWIRGVSIFNSGFLARLLLFGLIGSAFWLLLPTLAVISGKITWDLWWLALRQNLAAQWREIRIFFLYPDLRHNLAIVSLTTLLPAFLPALRWKSAFGDRSRLGTELTSFLFHLVNGVLLGICLWGAFDPPFSGRQQAAHLALNLPMLTFYYLAALAAGYYSGYFLLVSRTLVLRKQLRRPPFFQRILHPLAVGAVLVLTGLTAAGLIYKNRPLIASVNSDLLKKYTRLMADSLPHTGGLLLADSETAEDTPRRLYLLQEELVQTGREKEYVPVDTSALKYPGYHRYLHQKYAARWPLLVDDKAKYLLNEHGLLGMMEMLSKTNDIYYLHPSFGYYFEVFYAEPHGLIYKLKHLPEDTLLPRLPDRALQAENEAFWARAENEVLAPVLQALGPGTPPPQPATLPQKIMARLHVSPEPNLNAQLAGQYYSRGLNFWGVQLQRANELKPAAARFAAAQKLNPDNEVAAINYECNQNLQADRPGTVNLSKITSEQVRAWGVNVSVGGPYDEPSYCFEDGLVYFQSDYIRQAIASFARVREFVPGHLPALLSLGELYDLARRPDRALEALQEPLAHPARFSLNDTNSTELNIVAAAAYIQKTNLLRGVGLVETEIARHPDDHNLLSAATQLYLNQGLLTNALRVIQLELDRAPGDPAWLFSQGYTYMRMNDYDHAIASLTQVLTLQTNNYDALFNRAVAYLNTGRLEPARSDYQQLQKAYPKAFQIAYGLGDIAWRQHDTNTALQNYTIYLANAPTNMAEFQMISQRVAGLKNRPH